MQKRNEKISPLKKVTLTMVAGQEPDSMDLLPFPSQFEFIFGLEANGLSQLEYELADRCEGDEMIT